MTELIEIYIMFSFVIDKPPDDPYERKWYFKRKQQYTRFLRFYGNSLVGGIDKAKIITVTETEAEKKKGKKKPEKVVSIDKKTITNISFQKYLVLPFTIYIKSSDLHLPVKKTPRYLLYTFNFQSKKAAQIIAENNQKRKGVTFM